MHPDYAPLLCTPVTHPRPPPSRPRRFHHHHPRDPRVRLPQGGEGRGGVLALYTPLSRDRPPLRPHLSSSPPSPLPHRPPHHPHPSLKLLPPPLQIARLIAPIYPELLDHPSTYGRPSVLALSHPAYFITHSAPEATKGEIVVGEHTDSPLQ
eukprot:scaffold21824_cov86-Isochrysis_galbana.AAC.1